MSIYFESAENIMNKIATRRNFNVTDWDTIQKKNTCRNVKMKFLFCEGMLFNGCHLLKCSVCHIIQYNIALLRV